MTAQSKIETATLASAMALAFAEIEAATKTAENAAFKQGGKNSKYADLGAVIDAIKPSLIAHGLFFTQRPQPSNGGVTVETVLHHASGESISLGALFVPANKNDAHGFGSALTYCRRYGLMTAFGVPAEDDDGNAAVASAPARNAGALVSDEQLHVLQDKANAVGADLARFCAYFKVPSLKDVPAARFREALDALDAKAKRQPELAK